MQVTAWSKKYRYCVFGDKDELSLRCVVGKLNKSSRHFDIIKKKKAQGRVKGWGYRFRSHQLMKKR